MFKNGSLGYTQQVKVEGAQTFQYEVTNLSYDGVYNISVAGFTSIGAGIKSDVITGETGEYGTSLSKYFAFIMD